MNRREAFTLIGRTLRVLTRYGWPMGITFRFARYDASRFQFTLRSVHTSREHTLSVALLEDGVQSGILQIGKRERITGE